MVSVLDHRTETIHAYRVRPGARPELERLECGPVVWRSLPGGWRSLMVLRSAERIRLKGC